MKLNDITEVGIKTLTLPTSPILIRNSIGTYPVLMTVRIYRLIPLPEDF